MRPPPFGGVAGGTPVLAGGTLVFAGGTLVPRIPVLAILLGLLPGCAHLRGQGPPCTPVSDPAPLPGELDESSGVAISHRHPGLFWTHGDSGSEAILFGVDAGGRVLARVRVAGAENRDWEDLDTGPCPEGECLYIGDIGDNAERRRTLTIYRVPEPSPEDSLTAPARRWTLRYPDRPRDAEGLFVLAPRTVHLVTKGRRGPVMVFRAELAEGSDEADAPPVELEPVLQVTDDTPAFRGRFTGAGVSSGGTLVAMRSYMGLHFFRVRGDGLAPIPGRERIDLTPLRELQGEAVDVDDDGTVVLTTEGGPFGPGGIQLLRCTIPEMR